MVEVIANSIEYTLIDGLLFNLAKPASYITNRRSATCHPQGGIVYTQEIGVRLIQITAAGNDWLGPSTFRVYV